MYNHKIRRFYVLELSNSKRQITVSKSEFDYFCFSMAEDGDLTYRTIVKRRSLNETYMTEFVHILTVE